MKRSGTTNAVIQTENLNSDGHAKGCLQNCLMNHLKNKKQMNIMATMTLKKTQTGTMKAQLADILMAVSWSDLSRTYFGKSNSWLYHKLDGVDGNKKPTEFTIEERYQLKGALIDLADRIRRAADTID